jgi:hypothetical protein
LINFAKGGKRGIFGTIEFFALLFLGSRNGLIAGCFFPKPDLYLKCKYVWLDLIDRKFFGEKAIP